MIPKVCDAFSYQVDVLSDTDRRLARAFFLTAGFLALRRLVVFALLTHALPTVPPVFIPRIGSHPYFTPPTADCEGPSACCSKTLSRGTPPPAWSEVNVV